ncbi:MAG: hypothetical protein IK090_06260 [Clostridia bacterium]|nr:hypothetical protein [Clostridia bacterium]
MKKLAQILALALCLVLVAFAFASCKKKNNDATEPSSTTAAPASGTTDIATGDSTTGGEHVHTPESEYTIDTPATCTEPGSKSYHCSGCGEAIAETAVPIPATGHTPATEYTIDTPATCTEPGSKSYHCTVCSRIIDDTVVPISATGHTPATVYTVDVPATCSGAGSQSYHCTVCNVSIENTSVPIPSDPNAHVAEWADEKIPTLLDESGYRDGECSLCHAPIHEDLVWEPVIFNSKEPSGKYYDEKTGTYAVRETFGNIRGDKHFYPVSEENPLGNDLWFEYSLLWNETLANATRARIVVAEVTGWDPEGCEIFGLSTRDVAADDEFAGRFCFNRTYVYGSGAVDKKEGTNWFSSLATPSDCVLETGNGQPRLLGRFDETVTADSFAPIGNYGWHRIGFRYHLEADPSDPENAKALAEPGQKASYYAYTELYVDGVKVWKIQESVVGYWDGDSWENRSFALRPNDAVPFKLTASESYATTNSAFVDKAFQFNGLWYIDNDIRAVGLALYDVANSEEAVYIVIDDVQWTCGDGFVRNVEPVADPAAKDFTLADGVTVPGAIYFQEVEVHVHTQAADYTIDAPATCSADGSKSYHCIVCGDSIPGTTVVIPADPTLHDEVIEVKTPNLLDPDGYRRGECTICHQTVTNEVLTWEPVIFDSKNPTGDYYNGTTGDYAVRKTFGAIRGSKHFYPTEADPDGNDLWFEYSLLWNETLANAASARISAVDIVGYDPCEIYGLNTRDVAADEEFAGRFCFNRTYVYGSGAVDKKEGTEWTSMLDPASDCVLALDNGQPRYLGRFDETVTADSFAPIGGYGWHRIGFRLHMEADPSDPDNAKALAEPGQKGSYYAYTELYVDGVKVWKVEESIVGFWDGDSWENRSFALRPNDALPFILTADQTIATTKSAFKNKSTEYDGIWYVDKDNRSVGLCFAGVGNSENAVYIVIDDVQWTCGDGFVRNVEPVATPAADTITLAEGVEVPAAIYFKLAD